jgi:hypothetical protein
MDYIKYKKYKEKYLRTKKTQNGGAMCFTGHQFSAGDTSTVIMAQVTPPTQTVRVGLRGQYTPTNIKQAIEARAEILTGQPPKQPPHMTLFEIHWNESHPHAQYIRDQLFRGTQYTRQILQNIHFLFSNLRFESSSIGSQGHAIGDYKLFGPNNDFLVRRYTPVSINPTMSVQELVTQFRLSIYTLIKQLLQQYNVTLSSTYTTIQNGGVTFYVYSDSNNIPLYGIPDYYYGKGIWEPHISVAKLTPQLATAYSQNMGLIQSRLQGHAVGIISSMLPIDDLRKIIISSLNGYRHINDTNTYDL